MNVSSRGHASFFVALVLGAFSSPLVAEESVVPVRPAAPTATAPVTAAAQAAAIAKFPELARAGSAFNQEFLIRYRRYQTEKPAFFEDRSWPIALAEEVAKAGIPSIETTPGPDVLFNGRTAIPPVTAPPTVLRAIAAGNTLQTRGYKYGGGRDQLEDWGYDCSGTVSYVLIKAGLLDEPRTSGRFATYGEPGPGRWITIYSTPGHCFMTIGGLRLDTGGRGGVGERGPRWNAYPRSDAGYEVRHPRGF